MPQRSETTPPENIPLRLLRPLRVKRTASVSGVLWSFRPNQPPVLLLPWEGQQYGVHLGGRAAMSFFPIQDDVSLNGVLAQGGDFRVDVNTRYDAVQRVDPLGSLVLRGGSAFLVGMPLGERFGDTAPVPLWGEFEGADDDEAVGFSSWSLILRDGDEVFQIWRHEARDEL